MLDFMKKRTINSDKPSASKTLIESFNHFQIRNRAENRSPRTLEWYENVFEQLFKSQWGIPLDTPMGEISELKLLEYNSHLLERKWNGRLLKASSVNK